MLTTMGMRTTITPRILTAFALISILLYYMLRALMIEEMSIYLVERRKNDMILLSTDNVVTHMPSFYVFNSGGELFEFNSR